MKEDQFLLALAEDKLLQCSGQYMPANTNFLDIRQRGLVEKQCRALCKNHREVTCDFCGGYEDAERTIAVFLPDYMGAEEYDPLAAIRIFGGSGLTHRDFLGALLGLGLKREMIGDILVSDKGTDVIILKELQDFLITNFEKAGRALLKCEAIDLAELSIPENHIKEKKDTVASLRLDNVVASAFSLSRSKAAEAIRRGTVFVNNLQAEKPDMSVSEGDKLVLRGKGKAVLREVAGKTRKDRFFIVIQIYQ